MQQKNSFRHESLHDRKSIQELLKAITKGIAKGEVTFSDEDGDMVMQPNGLLNLKVTASEDDYRHKIDLRISWQVDESDKKSKQLVVK